MVKKCFKVHKENFVLIVIIFMLLGSVLSIKPLDRNVEVIIILKGEPTASLAKKYGLNLTDPIIREAEEDKLQELKTTLTSLQNHGIPLKITSYMYTVIFGVVAELPSRFIQTLNRTGKISSLEESKAFTLDLENSVKMVDAKRVWDLKDAQNINITGKGVKVAIIDTGVNYSQPILGGGIGPNYKIIGGYDFVDKDNDPMDIDGHGTAVTAIIAGKDDKLVGIAPDASILAYRAITETKETSTAAIIQAVDRAVLDGANVINLSLGSASSDVALGTAINHATDLGIVVVAAAGNSGPNQDSIDYPSALNSVISVGASSNIGSPLLKAEFAIPGLGKSFEAIPLNNTISTKNPIMSRLVYVGLGGENDVANLNLKDAIAIAKRGTYYFSDKAKNVQEKGAIALIIYNNITNNFIGLLKDPVSIPVASISGTDGEMIMNLLSKGELEGNLTITSDPYQVVWFSSRGPASPFFIKPNLIAPGYGIETANYQGGYITLAGTSFASPHVVGAVALIKQAKPKLGPYQIMSLLMDNALPLTTGIEKYPVDMQGAGLVQVYNALISDFSVLPGSLVYHLSPWNQFKANRTLQIVSLSEGNLNVTIAPDWLGPDDIRIKLKDSSFINGSTYVTIEAQLNTQNYGTYYGWLNISSAKIIQKIPVRVQVNPIGISIIKDADGQIAFKINQPQGFLSAKVLIQMPNGSKQTISYKSSTENITFKTTQSGEYWISVVVNTNTDVQRGYNIVIVGRSVLPPTITTLTTLLPSSSNTGIPFQALSTITYTLILTIICIAYYTTIKRKREKN